MFKNIAKNTDKNNISPWSLKITFPAILVMVTLLVILLIRWQSSYDAIDTSRREVISRRSSGASNRIQGRFESYENILRTSKSLINSNNRLSITSATWADFFDAFDIEDRHPGLQDIGYAPVVESAQKSDFESTASRQADLSQFEIFPTTIATEYAAILHVAPLADGETSPLIGYDLYSDPELKKALHFTRDNNTPSVIDIRGSNMEEVATNDTDLLFIVPIYSFSGDTMNTEQRKKSIKGYVYASFYSEDFFSSLLTDEEKYFYELGIEEDDEITSLYTTTPDPEPYQGATQTVSEAFSIGNYSFVTSATNTASTLDSSERNGPINYLLDGIVFIAVVTGFIYLLTRTLSRDLQQRENMRVQQAKNDLLALASHQLRTPATGVKQYLGMIREGYAGKVTEQQLKLIDSAYESNERQLQIVNALLFVARLDASKVTLMPEVVDAYKLMQQIVREQRSSIVQKNQSLEVRWDKEKAEIHADKGYLRMALENGLNNAIKYTPDNGKIRINITSTNDKVRIAIQDDGIGVAEHDIPKLFQKFSRIQNKLSSQTNGTGVGLYLAQKIIEAHEGVIVFHSKVNVGSTLDIQLPKILKKQVSPQLDILQ
ncbi:hypothetical protein BH23PAT2_BH23PAT2_02120 [soil metagenome]